MGSRRQQIDAVLRPTQIAGLPASPAIKRFEWHECVDSTGLDALDITAVLDGEPEPEEVRSRQFVVFDAILHALVEAGVDLYPYVWLRTETDLAEQDMLREASVDEEANAA